MSTAEKRSEGEKTRRELAAIDALIRMRELEIDELCDLRKILEERIDGGALREWVQ